MDVEIIDEEDNPMLHRTDVRFQLTHDEATPSRLSVRDSLAAKVNKDAGEVVVHELDTKYGMRKTVGYAKVYDDADAAASVEQRHMLERNKITGGEADEPATDDADEPATDDADEADDGEDAADGSDDVSGAEDEEAAADEADESDAEAEEA
jgi:small subunit ribosomal protein S24e